jgi:hypothetical protein
MPGEPNQAWIVVVCFAIGIVVTALVIGSGRWRD